MRSGSRIAILFLIALAAPAAARDWPISTVASFGPAPSVGIGAKDFGAGSTFALEAAWHPERGTHWLLRGGRTDLARDVDANQTTLMLFNGGALYVPPPRVRELGIDVSFLQVGIRQSRALGRVRPFAEAAVGASVVRDGASRVQGANNDRRIAWTSAGPEPAGYETRVAPSFSVGLGAVTALPGRIALATSVAADFTALHGLVGAQLPMRFGATWPAGPAEPLAAAGPRAPRFRASAGWSALHTPDRIAGRLGQGHTFAGEVELPLGDRLAVSLAGEHDTREYRETVYRQQVDGFGQVEMVPVGSVEGAFAATVGTLGVRLRQHVGPLALTLRTGAGFGRTSGFGTTIESVSGAYLGPNGEWLPAIELGAVGGGAAATGWAYAMAAGAELRVRGPVRVFAESGLTSIELRGDHVRTVPLRFGLATR